MRPRLWILDKLSSYRVSVLFGQSVSLSIPYKFYFKIYSTIINESKFHFFVATWFHCFQVIKYWGSRMKSFRGDKRGTRTRLATAAARAEVRASSPRPAWPAPAAPYRSPPPARPPSPDLAGLPATLFSPARKTLVSLARSSRYTGRYALQVGNSCNFYSIHGAGKRFCLNNFAPSQIFILAYKTSLNPVDAEMDLFSVAS